MRLCIWSRCEGASCTSGTALNTQGPAHGCDIKTQTWPSFLVLTLTYVAAIYSNCLAASRPEEFSRYVCEMCDRLSGQQHGVFFYMQE